MSDADPAQRCVLHKAVSIWMDEADPAARPDVFGSLGEALQRACPERAAYVSEAALTAAFARRLLRHAQQAVAAEAARAGHADSYDILAAWLEQEADGAVLESLGRALGRSPVDLRTALGRLRQRFLQRVEAGLADWCISPAARQTLRRRLRDAVLSSETSA